MKRVALFFSGGKDSTLTLYRLLKNNTKVEYLISTITRDFDRVSIHGVRKELLIQQSASLGIPLMIGYISRDASNEEYEESMGRVLEDLKSRGIRTIAFGDIFLQDIREYREKLLARHGMEGLFPLWMESSLELAQQFVELGFKAIITSSFYPDLLGKRFDMEFISRLPRDVDPCGENGEFHTFVYDGPLFSFPIRFRTGRKLMRDNGYSYIDLIPHNRNSF